MAFIFLACQLSFNKFCGKVAKQNLIALALLIPHTYIFSFKGAGEGGKQKIVMMREGEAYTKQSEIGGHKPFKLHS